MSSTVFATLLDRIQSRRASVGVIGLGYVGLPLAVEFAHAGFDVTGFDVDASKVAQINAGRSYIPDVPVEELSAVVHAGKLQATSDMSLLAGMDAIDICVPTPLRKTKDPDLSYVVLAVEAVAATLKPASSSFSSRRPIPAPPTRWSSRCSRPRACGRTSTSSWRFRPSGSIRATNSSPRRTSRRLSAGVGPSSTEVAAALYESTVARVVPRQLDARRRDGEAAGEHVSSRQHRPRQRDRVDVPQDGHQRVGSHRRGQDQAVRIHALLSGSRARRPLHSDRSVLFVVEGAAKRLRMPLHRAGRTGQLVDAGVCRRTRGRSVEHGAKGRSTGRAST